MNKEAQALWLETVGLHGAEHRPGGEAVRYIVLCRHGYPDTRPFSDYHDWVLRDVLGLNGENNRSGGVFAFAMSEDDLDDIIAIYNAGVDEKWRIVP